MSNISLAIFFPLVLEYSIILQHNSFLGFFALRLLRIARLYLAIR